MKPYRRHLIGVPLQHSVFSDIDRAPEFIGLTGVLPDDRLGAWLDDDGDLFLNATHAGQLAQALPERISPEFLNLMEHSLRAACHTVERATKLCRHRAPAASADEARRLICALGASLRALVPFGILSKFVPDALYKIAASPGGDDVPQLRHDSPGTVLTREAFALFEELRDTGFPPDRLLSEWPAVPSLIAERIRSFCAQQAGFGPLQWETAGYEDPRYVFAVLRTIFAESDSEQIRRRLRGSWPAGGPVRPFLGTRDSHLLLSPEKMLRRVIVVWLEFLERETWYVRRAFYVGLAPLLLRLLSDYKEWNTRIVAEDVLFLTLDELTVPRPDIALARSRREKYLANSGYLTEHGISPGRLGSVLGAF